ncbi:MAG: thiamine-phosphate kinase, partial [Thiotrichales bacterium]|nr:thiamine-phosphate kinase [Thiotrichales bacterium]
NLSDMAAMGSTPKWITLALTLPEANGAWLREFSQGLFSLARRFDLALIGGDITRGPLTITIQIHGVNDPGSSLQRSGARPGDLVYVTGELGRGGIAWAHVTGELELSNKLQSRVLGHYRKPAPRIEAGLALHGLASSAIDISDGVIADLGHILKASNTGGIVRIADLPVFDTQGEIDQNVVIDHALSSGDDYELCFTVAADRAGDMEQRLQSICPVSCIGEINDGQELVCLDTEHNPYRTQRAGFMHFG